MASSNSCARAPTAIMPTVMRALGPVLVGPLCMGAARPAAVTPRHLDPRKARRLKRRDMRTSSRHSELTDDYTSWRGASSLAGPAVQSNFWPALVPVRSPLVGVTGEQHARLIEGTAEDL